MKSGFGALLVAVLLPSASVAEGAMTLTPYDGSFDDATFAVENAIIDRGLVIDYVSHVGEMLARTKEDVGGGVDLFDAANVYLFCSAALSRKVMEADPMNIAHCPYGVVVIDTGEGVSIGHRNYPDGPMQEVEALLGEIVEEAAGG